MRDSRIFGLLLACLAIGAVAAAPVSLNNQIDAVSGVQEQEQEQEQEEKKYTINEVMKLAHKDGLLKKVATGEASAEEKQQLVVLYKAMAVNKPPVGDEESWKERSGLLIKAAEAAAKGEEDASDRLLKASNCKACHDPHKE